MFRNLLSLFILIPETPQSMAQKALPEAPKKFGKMGGGLKHHLPERYFTSLRQNCKMKRSRRCILFICLVVFFGFAWAPSQAHAQCSAPEGLVGARNYDVVEGTYTLCDGTDWVPFHVAETLPGSCSLEGEMDFDTDESAYKYCTSGEWKKIQCIDDGAGGGTAVLSCPGKLNI